MHKLLSRQLRSAAKSDSGVDIDALIAIVDQTYDEFDRERRLNDRAARLMEDELKTANAQAKREHDTVLAAILDNATDGMLVVQSDGSIEIANAAARTQFAADAAGLRGQQIATLLGERAHAIAQGDESAAKSGEMTGTALDGRNFPVECSVTSLELAGGRRQLWIVRDISGRTRAQREIVENRMRFQDFAEASSDCFWEMDHTCKDVQVSSALETDVATQLKDILSSGPRQGRPKNVAEEGWRALHHHLAARQRFRVRVDLRLPDGESLYISVSGKPVFDLEGRFQGYRGTGRDVSREVTARVAARRAERHLVEAMDAAPSAVALVDHELNLIASNSALRALASANGEKLAAGRPFAAFLNSAFSNEMAANETTPANALRRLADAREMKQVVIGDSWYLLAARSLSGGGMVLNFSDVTAFKERETELAEARLAAESANRLKSQFLATMSHELRTPLNAILGFSEVIRDCVFGRGAETWDKYREYADSIHTSGRHLLSLISEILDLSKIEAGSYVLDLATHDMREILHGALTIISPAARKAGVDVKGELPDGPLLVSADERAVRQIALNLLANAVKFTPKGGHIVLKMLKCEGAVEFAVSDTGIGIAKEHLDSVFELFRQVDASIARRHEGTGLGLAITKRLVELHGGTICIESELSAGTTVKVRLPIVLNASATPAAPQEQAA